MKSLVGTIFKVGMNFAIVIVLMFVFYKMEVLNYLTTYEGFRDIFGGRSVMNINWARELAISMVLAEVIMVVALAFPGDLKDAPKILQLFVGLYSLFVIPDAALTWFFYSNEVQSTDINAPTVIAEFVPVIAPILATFVNTVGQILIAVMFGQFIEIFMKNFSSKQKQSYIPQTQMSPAQQIAMKNFTKHNRGSEKTGVNKQPYHKQPVMPPTYQQPPVETYQGRYVAGGGNHNG